MIDELETLRAWTPPGEETSEAGATATAHAAARARLDAHVARTGKSARRDRRPARHRPASRRWWLVAFPAALTAAAIAFVLALGSDAPEGGFSSSRTATAPQPNGATAAAATPDAVPRPDQFFYTKSRSTYNNCRIDDRGDHCVASTQTREAWISLDRDGQVREVVEGADPGHRAGTMGLHPNSHYFVGNDRYSYEQLRDFDLSADALYQRLRDGWQDGQGGGLEAELFTWVGDALREQPAPPKLRAALYGVLSRVAGVTFTEDATDDLGRRAVVASRVDRGVRRELLFDPGTYALLAERDTTVATGEVAGQAVYVERGVVDAVGQRP